MENREDKEEKIDITEEVKRGIRNEISLIKANKNQSDRSYFTEYERGRLASLKLVLGWIYSFKSITEKTSNPEGEKSKGDIN
ncbi:MAG: hypothetical protein ACOC7O_02885 [Thermoplasmatota archaeon]